MRCCRRSWSATAISAACCSIAPRPSKRRARAQARAELVAGDFLREVPAGGDLYILKLIVHDWSDEDALAILRNCRAAMTPDARLMVVERLAGAPDEPLHTRIAALFMLHVTGGIERTEDEFRALFRRAGFTLDGVTATPSDLFLLPG